MRSYLRTAVLLLVLVPAVTSHAADDVTRFRGEFVLGNGNPVTEVRQFPATAGSATLKLYNGARRCSWGKRVSGAWVSVNGKVVFSPSGVNERVGRLQATVALKQGCNVLKVGFKGKPGAKIRIKIIQEAEACGPNHVDVALDGTQADDGSGELTISGDGRFVAFGSGASNLVPGDTNGEEDVFVHDRQTGVTERVSVASDGTQADGGSGGEPSISGDGRFVAFDSGASNLVPGDTNGEGDVFVHDRQTGVTERISVSSDGAQGDGGSGEPSISGDGRFVAFVSGATNLVPGDTNEQGDVFVHDRQTGVTKRISVASDGAQGDGGSGEPSISVDGRFVAFSSQATNLVSGDTNGWFEEYGYVLLDVFVHDRQTGMTERVSVASDGTQGDEESMGPSISGEGRFVAFLSWASNLAPGDSTSGGDVFVHDRQTGVTERISMYKSADNVFSFVGNPSISSDGRFVTFNSYSPNLVPGDTNGQPDIFVHDRHTGVTRLLSLASDGTQANDWSYNASISADGRFVAFGSRASNLVLADANGTGGLFVTCNPPPQLLETCGPSLVSVASDGTQANAASSGPSISGDGRFVAFSSFADNLVPGDTNGWVEGVEWYQVTDVFVHDRKTGVTERVSVASDGAQADHESRGPSISGDGRFVAFSSYATNLVPDDTNGWTEYWWWPVADVFVHDRQTGVTERVSVASDGTQANDGSDHSSISRDGRFVAFESGASNLVPGDTNGWDVFVHDRKTGVTERVSVASDGTQADGESGGPSISSDGRFVAFGSYASNLVPGDTNGWVQEPDGDWGQVADVFVHDRQTGVTERVSVASDGTQADNGSGGPSISGDGRFVAFSSVASNLVPGDTNGWVQEPDGDWGQVTDVFVHDRQTGVTERVSVASDGTQANNGSGGPSISGDGRLVAFGSGASNLLPGDTNEEGDVFVHDRLAGVTEMVSLDNITIESYGAGSHSPSISDDGKSVAFAFGEFYQFLSDGSGQVFVTYSPLGQQGNHYWHRRRHHH
jgi:Tol biopolymer transport system component